MASSVPRGAQIRLPADLVLTTSSAVLSLARVALAAPDTSELVLDLADVVQLDWSGVGALVTIRAMAQEAGATVRIINARPPAYALLRRAGLVEIFNLDSGHIAPPRSADV